MRYIGYGPSLPSRRHEIFDPKTGAWSPPAPARAAGGPAAILADGRVAKIGLIIERVKNPNAADQSIERSRPMLELSDVAGQRWKTIDFPPEATLPDSVDHNISLFAVHNDAPGLARALFLGVNNHRTGWVAWWWFDDLDATPLVWRSLPNAVAPYRFPPGEHAGGHKAADGWQLYFTGGHNGVIADGKR